jgi:ribosomal protein L7/L12
VTRLERNVDRLLQHHGLSTESPLPELPAVIEEIERGRKIHAIKAYRELTGADLKEAKDFVDDLEIQLRGPRPRR